MSEKKSIKAKVERSNISAVDQLAEKKRALELNEFNPARLKFNPRRILRIDEHKHPVLDGDGVQIVDLVNWTEQEISDEYKRTKENLAKQVSFFKVCLENNLVPQAYKREIRDPNANVVIGESMDYFLRDMNQHDKMQHSVQLSQMEEALPLYDQHIK